MPRVNVAISWRVGSNGLQSNKLAAKLSGEVPPFAHADPIATYGRRLAASACIAFGLSGCAATSVPVSSVGRPRANELRAEPLLRVARMPHYARDLGSVVARCVVAQPAAGFVGISLGSLDCSTALLARAIEERAKQVAATALVGLRCFAQSDAERGAMRQLECEATLAIWSVAAGQHMASPSDVATVGSRSFDEPDVRAATEMSTTVDFIASGRMPTCRGLAQASEVPRQPAADIPFGEVAVRLAIRTELSEAVAAVALAATAIGAQHFVSPQCFRTSTELGWTCYSRLSSPEVDERVVQARP